VANALAESASKPLGARAAASIPAVRRVSPWPVVGTLAWRELVRFFRQRNRVIGAIGQPVLFWLLFGAGLSGSFRAGGAEAGQNFLEYFFPGNLALILLFTSIFATVSIIEDRREGFLQSILVAPAPRWTMVLGKILGGTAIAVLQGLVFLLLGLTIGIRFDFAMLAAMIAMMAVVSFGLTALGFVLVWRMDSTQGFHAVMSVLLMPMWLLSGAFFPAESPWLKPIMLANPLTYGVAGMRRILYWNVPGAELPPNLPSLAVCWSVALGFAAVMTFLAWRIARHRTRGDLL
jgi:ABC-2 type transport system permease protein